MNLSRLCPDMCIDRVEHIDLWELKRMGYNTLLVDLDNTLVSWRSFRVRREVREWLEKARSLGFRLCLISNCILPFRVRRLSRLFDIPAIARARKPGRRCFLEAIALTRGRPESTVVIGDQVFKDILGGNRLGFYTILVRPVDRTELLALTPLLHRAAEQFLLGRMRRRGMLYRVAGSPAVFRRAEASHPLAAPARRSLWARLRGWRRWPRRVSPREELRR